MDFAAVTALFLATLEDWRAEGLTQDQAAQRLGVSGPYVSQVRGGVRQLGAGSAQKFADALGIGVGELLSRADAFAAKHPDRVPKRPTRDDGRPTLDRIPGYAEVEAAARARAPYLPAVAWEKTRAMSGAALADLTPELLVGFATTWAQVAAGRLRELPPDEGTKPPPVTKKR